MIERIEGRVERIGEDMGRHPGSPDDAFMRLLQASTTVDQASTSRRPSPRSQRVELEVDVPMVLTATGRMAFAADASGGGAAPVEAVCVDPCHQVAAPGTHGAMRRPGDVKPDPLRQLGDAIRLPLALPSAGAPRPSELTREKPSTPCAPAFVDAYVSTPMATDRQVHVVPLEGGVAVYVRDYRSSGQSLLALGREMVHALRRASAPLTRLIINGDRIAGKE